MSHFKLALNTSTLIPFRLDVIEQVNVAREAGYDGIELWMKDIEDYLSKGGTIKELKQVITQSGLTVANAIAFFKWSDIDEKERKNGLIQAQHEMGILSELGCTAVAAPPSGNVSDISLITMAEHFAELIYLGRNQGVEPYLEFWGHSPKLSKLSEAMYVAMESGFPDVKILLDPFHMYKGGSDFNSLAYLNQKHIGIVHVNDYPTNPPREQITDRDRVFPGDGIAPSSQISGYLDQMGYQGYLSLELFIENFGELTAVEVALQGLEKMKKVYRLT